MTNRKEAGGSVIRSGGQPSSESGIERSNRMGSAGRQAEMYWIAFAPP